MRKDYYKILGISKESSLDEVKKAYKALALKYHPDKNNGSKSAEEKFKEVSEAYAYISSNIPEKEIDKSIFRRSTHSSSKASEKYFWQTLKKAPRIISISTDITFEESIRGVKKNIKYSFQDRCDACDLRQQSTKASDKIQCPSCLGSGKLNHKKGYISVFVNCTNCDGTGFILKKSCLKCNNLKKVTTNVESRVSIPPGILSGDTVRVMEPMHNIMTRIKINVMPSDTFRREGNNILSALTISLKEALLGCSKSIVMATGEAKTVEIPSCVSNETKLRLKGCGANTVNSTEKGDHLVKIHIAMPNSLTDEQKKIIEKL